MAAAVGIDVGWFVRLDPLARSFAMEILDKSIEIADKRDRHLAVMIIEELALAMTRK